MAVATWRDIDALHRAVNSVRERRKALKAANDASGQDAKLAAIEEQLMQVNMNGSEANLAFPGMLNEQYAGFAQGLEDADTPPTRQQTALFDSLHERLQAQLTALAALK
jgi:small-conductance mechanosensitive channel